ncbi:MAG: membrane protein insertion efficiency factor YidD [Dehalococcoidia bacterium]|nr:membrane protein insertion efficiency factor YidD [Dehalococcoidia bacterium]
MRGVALAAIRFYQRSLSPLLGARCRYEPTCSRYAYEAIEQYGVLRGGWMGIVRLLRCHPGRAGGYDPVPELLARAEGADGQAPPVFHVKHNVASARTRQRALLVLAVSLLSVLAAGCASVAQAKGWASPIRSGELVIAQTKNGVVSALQLTGGELKGSEAKLLWSFPGDDDDIDLKAVYGTPAVAGSTLYIASYSGLMVALDLKTGRPSGAWGGPIDLGDRVVASPLLIGDMLYVTTERGSVVAIDARTGARRQLTQIEATRIWGSPQADAGTLYLATLDSRLVAVDRSEGGVRWSRDLGAVAGDLRIDDGLLLVGSFDRELRALDLSAEGAPRWSFKGDAWFWGRPLVSGDTIYAATVNGTVYAIDRASGRERWHSAGNAPRTHSAPVLAGGVLVIASGEGRVTGIDPANGATKWNVRQEGRRFFADPLVLESGVVYLDDSGALWLVEPASGLMQRVNVHN